MNVKRFFILFVFLFLLPLFSYGNDEHVITAKKEDNISFIHSSGRTSSLLLSNQGIVYGWGLWGEGSNISLSKKLVSPTDISSSIKLNDGEEFVSVYSGEQHSFVLTSFGRVFGIGSGEKRQLGYKDYLFKSSLIEITEIFPLLENEKIIHMACSDDFNIVLTSNHRVLSFGLNEDGQLGIDTEKEDTLVYDITDYFVLQEGDYIKDVKCGASHTLALSNNGYLYGWGCNKFGQLTGTEITINNPKRIESITDSVIKIDCGRYSSYVLTNQNTLYGFGSDSYGQLASNEPILTSNKKDVPYLMNSSFSLSNDEYIVDVIAGYYYAIVKTNLNNFYSFGQNSSGQLANGSSVSTSVPSKIEYKSALDSIDEIASISCGQDHCIAISKYGKILAWGSNLQNQLSEDSSISQSFNKMIDITCNFPPIVLISTTSASVEFKEYYIDVSAYYLDNQEIKETYYCISDSTLTPNSKWIQFDNQIFVGNEYEGTIYIHIRVDSEKGSYYHVSKPLFLDHINPTIKAYDENNKEFLLPYSNSTIFLKASDNNNDVSIVYTLNGKQYLENTSTLSLSDDGKYVVYAMDKANNSSATIEFTIDTILPTITKIDNNLIHGTSYNTREKQITIQGSEALSCYLLGYKGVKQDSYIALNENESSFDIKLKKGVNTLTIFDLAGNQSISIDIIYSPRFFQDTQLLLIVFSTLASIFIFIIVFIYSIKNKRKLTK